MYADLDGLGRDIRQLWEDRGAAAEKPRVTAAELCASASTLSRKSEGK
jgi:hypothetical protein